MARILVVDDDHALRSGVRVVLESAGHIVAEAADGEAGLRAWREQGADLLLVDVFMPERDGLELIRALRGAIPQPRIVAMSGGGRIGLTDVLSAAAAFGAARTLRKPFAPSDLLTVIDQVLEGSAP
jgi:two-component system chemotaxis response regulator CheY